MIGTAQKRFIRIGGVFGAVFGNPIVEIEGPFADDFSNLKWQFEDHRDGETATFRVCGIKAYVQDCDGDYSVWSVRRGKILIGEGSECEFFPALAAAEQALRAYVALAVANIKEEESAT